METAPFTKKLATGIYKNTNSITSIRMEFDIKIKDDIPKYWYKLIFNVTNTD
jgi:hypothetical protein